MWLCSFCTDVYTLLKPLPNDFAVKQPKRESIYFILCAILGMLFLLIRFNGYIDWQHLKPLVKLSIIPLVVFAFPIALAVIMLMLKYKPYDLGIRLNGLITAIPVLIISVIVNRLVSPTSLTWDSVVKESGGVLGALYSGLILADLSEEFFRVVGQTRLGALFKSYSIGWFITTLIWAFMHAPKWYADEHNFTEALLGSIRIIPIGLMWGYLTLRTKNILPAVLVHGTNYWGLQNF
jgi:membrane protease YdiL (CAAX protease family)